MGHIPLLNELTAIAALGVVVTLVLARLRLPAVAGLLLAGALCGPHGLKLVTSSQDIAVLAELGVVLLLFTIGLEFSVSRMRDLLKRVALGGVLQVGLTTLAVMGAAKALGQPTGRAVFFGLVFALSSTAIVLRALTERRELDAPHGRFIVGTLIFQDLCVVPMVLVVPLLGPSEGKGELTSIGLALLKAGGVVAGTLLVARFVVPRILSWVDRARSREVFLLAILGISLGAAWLTSLAGLSLALGAFLGGMVVADTEFGHRAMGDVAPLRDAFVSIFFVSLGMLFDVHVLLASPLLLAGLTVGLIIGKGLLATAAALVMRFPARVAWLAGVGLAQFGEFGFVLAQLGRQSGVVDEPTLAPVLSAGVLTMFLTPLLVRVAPHVRAGEKLLAPLARRLGARGIDDAHEAPQGLEGHVVVVGYGVAGRVLAGALEACEVKTVVLELNAETVRKGRTEGAHIYYADATSEEALQHAYLAKARAMVLVMNDPAAARRVLDTARRVAPDVPVLLRTHYLAEVKELLGLGASEVVAEEVESAVEMLVRVLRWLDVPRNVIDRQIRVSRERTYSSERKPTVPRRTLSEIPALAELKLEHVVVEEGSPALGQSLRALELRNRTGALVVALQRGGQLVEELDPEAPLIRGDVVFLAGRGESVRAAIAALSAPA
ncbi:MAG: cation:proton antiporter [Myxococcales bacterium]|nr:cation:proton antiporter [Myxococcales bacterium]